MRLPRTYFTPLLLAKLALWQQLWFALLRASRYTGPAATPGPEILQYLSDYRRTFHVLDNLRRALIPLSYSDFGVEGACIKAGRRYTDIQFNVGPDWQA